jgi:radical SAM superfamily enzyme YgiQ (UPF0313 family)
MSKIQLVLPQGGESISGAGVLPPLGLLSLATYTKSKNPDIAIELFDGELVDHETIKANLEGDFLGLSTTRANYRAALELAKEAKQKGMAVILGGPHATVKHKEILKNQDCIDVVIRRDGEAALNQVVQTFSKDNLGNLKGIRNLSYREGKNIIVNPPLRENEQMDLNNLPGPDYKLLNESSKEYIKNFQQHPYRKEGYSKYTSLESQRGCARTQIECGGRCTFCAIVSKGLRRLDPEEFWERTSDLTDSFEKTIVWDVSDSFAGRLCENDNWLEEIAEQKPAELNDKIDFVVFARADELNDVSVRALRQIGVSEIAIGIESGDQDKLDAINKGTTIRQNFAAVENLRKYGIRAFISLVYGLPGEDSESLEKTYRHVKKLVRKSVISGIRARVLVPLSGSVDYQRMLRSLIRSGKSRLAGRIRNSDYWDHLELRKLWIGYMTNTNFGEIREYHSRIVDMADGKGVTINGSHQL